MSNAPIWQRILLSSASNKYLITYSLVKKNAFFQLAGCDQRLKQIMAGDNSDWCQYFGNISIILHQLYFSSQLFWPLSSKNKSQQVSKYILQSHQV